MSAGSQFAPRYTVNDYRHWQGDWELWDGVAIAMSPSPFGIHQGIVFALARLIGNAIEAAKCDAKVVGELDWIVSDDTVVRPDVMVVCGELPDRHLHQRPALVAEVLSPLTRQNDLGFKRQLYARQGVPSYLIVDPDAQTIDKLSLTGEGKYEPDEVSDAVTLTLCDDCDIKCSIASVF